MPNPQLYDGHDVGLTRDFDVCGSVVLVRHADMVLLCLRAAPVGFCPPTSPFRCILGSLAPRVVRRLRQLDQLQT